MSDTGEVGVTYAIDVTKVSLVSDNQMIQFLPNCLCILRYEDVPDSYQLLSTHGGDEDWVLYCPVAVKDCYLPGGLESVINGDEGSYLMGWGHVDKHVREDGDIVVIFAHA